MNLVQKVGELLLVQMSRENACDISSLLNISGRMDPLWHSVSADNLQKLSALFNETLKSSANTVTLRIEYLDFIELSKYICASYTEYEDGDIDGLSEDALQNLCDDIGTIRQNIRNVKL